MVAMSIVNELSELHQNPLISIVMHGTSRLGSQTRISARGALFGIEMIPFLSQNVTESKVCLHTSAKTVNGLVGRLTKLKPLCRIDK
jgi:hypothetical protein